MKLFEFVPDETGYDSFYIMSENEDEALKNLPKLEQGLFDLDYWEKIKHKYKINSYGANEPTWSENA